MHYQTEFRVGGDANQNTHILTQGGETACSLPRDALSPNMAIAPPSWLGHFQSPQTLIGFTLHHRLNLQEEVFFNEAINNH